MNKFFLVIGICALSSLAGSFWGCGGGSQTADTGSSLSKAAFVKRADAICEESEAEQLKLLLAYLKLHRGAEEKDALEPAGIPPLETQERKIESLPLPSEGSSEVETWISQFHEALKAMKKDPPSALKHGKENPFAAADETAHKYGFKYCSNAP